MKWIKKCAQGMMMVVMPSIATAMFIGMAIHGSGMIRVGTHLFRNILLLGPKIPRTLLQLWREDRYSTEGELTLPIRLVILLVGFPFVIVLVLLDDYP